MIQLDIIGHPIQICLTDQITSSHWCKKSLKITKGMALLSRQPKLNQAFWEGNLFFCYSQLVSTLRLWDKGSQVNITSGHKPKVRKNFPTRTHQCLCAHRAAVSVWWSHIFKIKSIAITGENPSHPTRNTFSEALWSTVCQCFQQERTRTREQAWGHLFRPDQVTCVYGD